MYAGKTRKEQFSGPGENCQRNVTDLAGILWYNEFQVAGTATEKARRPNMERRCMSRYEQLMAAGGPQMLATSNVSGVDAAVRRVLWQGVTCHLADAGNEQCLRCGCYNPLRTV